MLSRCFFDFSVDEGGFCHRIESDLFLFLLMSHIITGVFTSTHNVMYSSKTDNINIEKGRDMT